MNISVKLCLSALFFASLNVFAEIDSDRLALDTIKLESQHFYITDRTKYLLDDSSTITYYYSIESNKIVESLIFEYADIIGDSHGAISISNDHDDLFLYLASRTKCEIPPVNLWPSLVLEYKKINACYRFDMADNNILMILSSLIKEIKKGFYQNIYELEVRVRARNVVDGYVDKFDIAEPIRGHLHKLIDDIVDIYISTQMDKKS